MIFKPNPAARAELMKEHGYGPGLRVHAEAVKAAVEQVAPRHTGDYANSIEVVEDSKGVYVSSSDPFAHIVEWGSIHNPPYAPIRRGVRAAGLWLAERRK